MQESPSDSREPERRTKRSDENQEYQKKGRAERFRNPSGQAQYGDISENVARNRSSMEKRRAQ